MRVSLFSFNASNITPLKNNSIVIAQQESFTSRFADGSKKPRHVKEYYAYQDYVHYNPRFRDFGDYKIPIHNAEVAKHLESKYSSGTFASLFSFVKDKGVFGYVMDDSGFIKTSMINRKENELMSDLIWITDSCNNMELLKYDNPDSCVKILNKLADLYSSQQDNFDDIIENPQKYKNNTFWGGATQAGVGHCFVPKTQQPHKWFAKTRLESIGNYLQVSTDMISTGLKGGNYGYKSSADIPDTVVDSIANCVKYLDAINYPTARSCGAWEEWTFVNSLTSDTSIINQGMRGVIDLMYSDTENQELLDFRARVMNSKNGDIFKDKTVLKTLLQRGEQRVKDAPDVETYKGDYSKKVKLDEVKYLSRDYDSALSFMPQTESLYPDDIYRDSAKKIFLLNKLTREIVKENGSIRYPNDEYLNLDYHTLKNVWTDNKKTNEAQWFLVSEIASGYGAVAKQLLDYMQENGTENEKLQRLLILAMKKETEYINRSYARITPKNMTKSNGYSCPAYKLPEAYEAVTTKNGDVKYVPGAHTPLTWAEASLHKASMQFLNNLMSAEDLNIDFDKNSKSNFC